MSLTISNIVMQNAGSEMKAECVLAADTSYPTNGYTFNAISVGLGYFTSVKAQAVDTGYLIESVPTSDPAVTKLKFYYKAGSTPAGTIAAPAFTATGTDRHCFSVSDLKGSANTDSENVDAATNPTNGALLKALDTFTNYAGTITPTISPDIGRNVAIVIKNDSGGALDLYEGVTTFALTGTYNGAAQTENITFTSSAGNKSVADTKFRYKYGSKPFDTLTSVAITNAPAGGLKASLGIGSKIGLPNTLKTPAEADVTKISKNAAHLSPSGIVDTTNNTVNLGALTDGDDVMAIYATLSGRAGTNSAPAFTGTAGSAGALSEVPNATNLSALTAIEIEAYGKL